MKNMRIVIVGGIAICLSALISYVFLPGNGEKEGDVDAKKQLHSIKTTKQTGGKKPVDRVRPRKGQGRRIADKTERVKPTFALDDDDEAKLTEAQRAMIAEIRAALDANNKTKVLKLVQKLQKSKEWPDGIPKAIKMAAIEALGWFGSSCLPEIVGFLEDLDGEVVQSAIEKYEDALSDFELSDAERAQIMVQASKVINDSDTIDSMLMSVNDICHSESVKMFIDLMEQGNEATKQVLPDAIEFYTGEEDMNSPEKLREWLVQNPDD